MIYTYYPHCVACLFNLKFRTRRNFSSPHHVCLDDRYGESMIDNLLPVKVRSVLWGTNWYWPQKLRNDPRPLLIKAMQHVWKTIEFPPKEALVAAKHELSACAVRRALLKQSQLSTAWLAISTCTQVWLRDSTKLLTFPMAKLALVAIAVTHTTHVEPVSA